MKYVEAVEASAKCFQICSGSMVYSSTCKRNPNTVRKIEETAPLQRLISRRELTRFKIPKFTILITIAVTLPIMTRGQAGSTYPSLNIHGSDPLKNLRALTSRAVITIDGRDQERYLTVFRASVQGHIEFGFPPAQHRPSGSLEIFDATTLSSACCQSGIRMVALRHVCSNSYLSLDKFGNARACQLTSDGTTHPLRRHEHCIDGEKLHACLESPYFYLDSMSRILNSGLSREGVELDNRYKLRFERRNTPNSRKKVYYFFVSRNTWEIKLRAQNGVIKKAVTDACERLWRRSVTVLFQRTLESYKKRRIKRNFRLQRVCDVNPMIVREDILRSVSTTQFTNAVRQSWHNHVVAEVIGSSVPWSSMSDMNKNVFVVISSHIVRKFLRSSLMNAANMYCLGKTQWGRMSSKSKENLLDRTLTISWFTHKVQARRVIIETMEKSINSKITTFVIKENG